MTRSFEDIAKSGLKATIEDRLDNLRRLISVLPDDRYQDMYVLIASGEAHLGCIEAWGENDKQTRDVANNWVDLADQVVEAYKGVQD